MRVGSPKLQVLRVYSQLNNKPRVVVTDIYDFTKWLLLEAYLKPMSRQTRPLNSCPRALVMYIRIYILRICARRR